MRAPKTDPGFMIPEGTHAAICIMVIDCGVWEREYLGNSKSKREIYLRWELPEVVIDCGDYKGKKACIGQRYTFSMFKKANLRRDLETWRGKPFTDEEADHFDVDKLLGQMCTLQIYRSDEGFDRVQFITPYRGGPMKPENALLMFDAEDPGNFDSLPEWVQRKINLPDYDAAKEYADVASSEQLESPDFDDDIPF